LGDYEYTEYSGRPIRHETILYAGASLTKILAVQKALNIEIKEEVIFR
jgi:hypothetical protein